MFNYASLMWSRSLRETTTIGNAYMHDNFGPKFAADDFGKVQTLDWTTGMDYWTDIFVWFLHMLWLVKLIFHWLRGH